MSDRKTTFTYKGHEFCVCLYKDGVKTRSRILLEVPEKGRYMQKGDVDSSANPPNTPLSTSYLATGDTAKDCLARNAAAERLLKKAEPYFRKAGQKTLTMKDVLDQSINKFMASTANRREIARRWNEDTRKQNL